MSVRRWRGLYAGRCALVGGLVSLFAWAAGVDAKEGAEPGPGRAAGPGVLSARPQLDSGAWFPLLTVQVLDRGSRFPVVDVSGDSGTGKSTLITVLDELLTGVVTLHKDDWHKHGRIERKDMDGTILDPRMTDLSGVARAAEHLLAGRAVLGPRYDHEKGTTERGSWIFPPGHGEFWWPRDCIGCGSAMSTAPCGSGST